MGKSCIAAANGDPKPWAIFLVILLAVVLPRFCALGYFVYMDEGYHAFIARYIWESVAAGHGFPPEMSGFKLFPILFSWAWALPGNAVVWLRLADLLFAACAGWAFCLMLARESRSAALGLVLGFAFLMGLNAPGAIQSGFKNSFSPAFLCFFCAINLARGAAPASRRWLYAGMLSAIAILFRETFAPFIFLALVSIFMAGGRASLWRYMAGGIVAALAVAAVSAICRGQLWGLVEWYFTYGKIYGPEEGNRVIKFLANGQEALKAYWPLLLATAAAAFMLARQKGKMFTGRAWLWLVAALLPLIEPFAKIGFLYHFSVCLPGMAGFCAYAYGRIDAASRRKAMLYVVGVAACLMPPLWPPQFAKLPVTMAALANYPGAGWPESVASQSQTLLAGQKLAWLAGEGGTASSSAFAYFLFPASGALPPKPGLGDLSRTYIYAKGDENKFLQALGNNPPDAVALAYAVEDHVATFYEELRDIFERHPDYEYAGEIKPDGNKNYGWLGYSFYKRKKLEP